MKAVVLCLALFACSVSADYGVANYTILTDRGQATKCTKAVAGNTPATCPPSAGVPFAPTTNKDGSTVCVTAVDGNSYEAVFSLTYPAAGAVPGCTSDAQCSPTGAALPGIVCGTNGPNGVPNTCFPLAPSGCPFPAADNPQKSGSSAVASPPPSPPSGSGVDRSSATTCTKAVAGNTPANCPPSAGVPLTAEGKPGSTVCITAVDGKSYEAVFSLTYPAANAVPGCTSDAQCSPSGSTLPNVVCGTNGPNGVPNTCWPLAPSGCPFPAADSPQRPANSVPAVATAGRKMAY